MNERDARRKLLLLQGTLYRLEIMHAKQSLREASSGNALAAAVPGLLKSIIANKGAALVTTVLPLLSSGTSDACGQRTLSTMSQA